MAYRNILVHIDDTKGMSEEELDDKIVIGKLVERNRSEFGAELRALNAEREAHLREEFDLAIEAPSISQTEMDE